MDEPPRAAIEPGAAIDTLRLLTDPALDPPLWPTAVAGQPSDWSGHVPFAHWLVTAAKPARLVELHAGGGPDVSYLAFCEAVRRTMLPTRCWVIYPPDADTADEVCGLSAVHDSRYMDFSARIAGDTAMAAARFADGSIDLLHLHGMASAEAARYEWALWGPKLSSSAIVLLHGTNVAADSDGVSAFWNELREQHTAFEFPHGHGLGLVALGSRLPTAIEALLALTSPIDITRIRERFAWLGARWTAEAAGTATRIEERRAAAERSDRRINLAETARLQAGRRADEAHAAAEAAFGRAEAAHLERQKAEAELAQAAAAAASSEAALGEARTALGRVQAEAAAALSEARAEAATAAGRLRVEAATAAGRLRVEAATTVSCLRAEAATAELELRERLASLEAEKQNALNTLAVITNSTAWRMTGPLRRSGAYLPPRLRRTLRRVAKLAWWTITLKLAQRLRQIRPIPQQSLPPGPGPAPAPTAEAVRRPLAEVGVRNEAVDVVICVHNALGSTRACIESVLRCTIPPYRVIIVDDGSDAETAAYLDEQTRAQGFVLLRRAEAGGYTRAANLGLRAVTAPWVVLLNSDTVVTMNWLERLWAHGARDGQVGVIGPLSNTASWQSVPQIFDVGEEWAENPLPADMSIDDMGDMIGRFGSGAVTLPFLNGFCYMIRSSLLSSVGFFDETTFGAGYGEENDYSIRVRKAGWSLVVATDVYVYHAQSKSYSQDRRLKLARRADELLMEKHDAATEIWPQAAFCRDNLPMVAVRARVGGLLRERALLREGRAAFEGKRIAFILPIAENGGGGNVVIQESLALQRMGVDVTLLNLAHLQRTVELPPAAAALLVRTFPNSEAMTAYLMANQDRYDAVIATLYRTVFWLPMQISSKLGYYVQDFEPLFFAEDDPEKRTALLSYTYSDRIRIFTKTRWNQLEVSRNVGRVPAFVGPSVDVLAFAPSPVPRASDPVRITAMIRPSTPRRAPERTIAGTRTHRSRTWQQCCDRDLRHRRRPA